MNYCAVIGDIVKSKKIQKRDKAKNKVEAAVKEINHNYEDSLTAEFMIYAGDEVQGLLTTPALSYQLIKELNNQLAPIRLVFGVGIGKLDTKIPSNPTTWELDGEAYHRARSMVNKAKKKRPSICYSFSTGKHTDKNSVADLINSLLYFIESNVKNRTKRQEKVVELYKKHKSQKKVADNLNITQVAVSKVLHNALYYEVDTAEKNITKYLKVFK